MLIAATHPFIDSLEHIAGFLVVMVVLIVLWMLTAIIGKLFSKLASMAPPPSPAAAMPVPGMVSEDEPTEEELVAVSACVAALMGERSRVVSIRRGGDWHREGRREHFASHKIR